MSKRLDTVVSEMEMYTLPPKWLPDSLLPWWRTLERSDRKFYLGYGGSATQVKELWAAIQQYRPELVEPVLAQLRLLDSLR